MRAAFLDVAFGPKVSPVCQVHADLSQVFVSWSDLDQEEALSFCQLKYVLLYWCHA